MAQLNELLYALLHTFPVKLSRNSGKGASDTSMATDGGSVMFCQDLVLEWGICWEYKSALPIKQTIFKCRVRVKVFVLSAQVCYVRQLGVGGVEPL